MRFYDSLELTIKQLRHRKLRSWLTVLGIVIGVAAVVSIVSIGEGMQAAVSEQLGGLGADTITVSAGYTKASGTFGPSGGGFGQSSTTVTLTEKDVTAIKSVPGVKYVSGVISERGKVYYLGENTSLSISGVDTSAWKYTVNTELDSGRYLSQGDTNAIVIGGRIASGVFKETLTLNRQLTIEGKPFRIIGILTSSGSLFGEGDRTIFMSIDDARQIFTDIGQDEVSSISVKASDPSVVDEVVNNTETRLMLSRHVTEKTKDFTVTSAASIRATISSAMSSITLFLGGIAAVSLLVGAVGIANTMYMSVLERTRQIGTLKALGSTNFEIMELFLLESAFFGLIGGVIGVSIGTLISFVIGGSLSMMGMGSRRGSSTLVTPELILIALSFAMLVGILSGVFPARHAAKLKPVEALRYE
jgi:putative ABC transport system permease protein